MKTKSRIFTLLIVSICVFIITIPSNVEFSTSLLAFCISGSVPCIPCSGNPTIH